MNYYEYLLMHYKCSRSEARRYLPDNEAGGEPPE